MSSVKQITKQIDDGLTLKLIADSYAEIASLKLKRIRSGIERNRDFSQELSGLFGLLKAVAQERRHLSGLVNRLVEKNSKTITVVVSSNHRFYGELTHKLMQLFIKGTEGSQTEKVVVGKNAIEYLKGRRIELNYQPLVFAEDIPTEIELNQLAQLIYPYKKIVFFHSAFKTVLTQVPTFTEITGDASLMMAHSQKLSETTLDKQLSDFILEPELETILKFFDGQILTLLIESIFLEEELARTASRLVTMSNSQQNADSFIKTQKRELNKAKKNVANNRLLETFVNYLHWQKGNPQ